MLTDVQYYVIAAIATIIVWVIKFASEKWGWKPAAGWLTVFVYIVSLIAAFVFNPVAFPPFPPYVGEPSTFLIAVLAYINSLAIAMGPMVAFATLFYNILLKRVMDGIAAKLA
jgi:hypothetical protein